MTRLRDWLTVPAWNLIVDGVVKVTDTDRALVGVCHAMTLLYEPEKACRVEPTRVFRWSYWASR